MHPDLKKTLKSLSLELRHLLEGYHDAAGRWHAGDMEQRLNALGVWRDRAPLPADELARHADADRRARVVIDAYLALRSEAGVALTEAAAEFTRETAYTWANRLLALRCMEARGLIDEVILQKEVYGGRSLEHHRLARQQPELCLSADDGLLAALAQAFARQAAHLPLLFDPQSPAVALTPSAAAIKQCVALLSTADAEIFQAADALGWAYQYWNSEEKDRVFAKVRTERGAKIEGADIIPATQLYTEPYMVQFLVQNSLGALWMGMYPDSKLYKSWAYYVRDADRAPVARKPLREVTFLDPACGSGHFLLEAFDLFYAMYEEEGALITPEAICAAILEDNLYGIDIDERAVQIAEAALWMKAAEKAFDFRGSPANLVATNIRLPRGKDHLAAFLAQHPKDGDLRPALEVIFEGLQHADELGSLLQLEEPVEKELRYLQAKMEERRGKPEQAVLFPELEKPKQGELPLGVESYAEWKTRTLARLKQHFAAEAQAADLGQAFFGRSAQKGVRLFDLLARRYDVVAANPPYMGTLSLGVILGSYLDVHFKDFSKDLFAAFIACCLSLISYQGRIALVAQRVFWFTDAFQSARRQFFQNASLRVYVDVGPGGFHEIAGEKVNTSLFVAARNKETSTFGAYVRIVDVDDKSATLLEIIKARSSGRLFIIDQSDLARLPRATLSYWAQKEILELLGSEHTLANYVSAKAGLATGDNSRWTRFWWETLTCHPTPPGWVPCMTGGDSRSYYTSPTLSVLWGDDGYLLREFVDEKGRLRSRPQNTQYYRKEGLTFSKLSSRRVYAKYLPSGFVFLDTSRYLDTPADYRFLVLGVLNSRLASYLLTFVAPGLSYTSGDIESLPTPDLKDCLSNNFDSVCQCIINLRVSYESKDVQSRDYNVHCLVLSDSLENFVIQTQLKIYALCSLIHDREGWVESYVADIYKLSPDILDYIYEQITIPSGWHSLIDAYDTLPLLSSDLPALPLNVIEFLQHHNRQSLSFQALSSLKYRLRDLYEGGPGTKLENIENTKDQDDDMTEHVGAYIPIPPETFLEELSQKLQIHPISVYWLLKEGIEQEGWRCRPEERRIAADRFTVLILRLLGHRWPKQIEAGEPVPPWADPDGVIPLTEGTHNPTLLERVRERLAAEFAGGEVAALEREFQEVMGQSLEAWLGQTFFKHHTRQFKKRPVAWQLQSGRWTARQQPAFACLVYYHKLDGDTLVTLQSQYVRPLRQRYEVELRGIESIPAAARSARQDARRVELGDLIRELSDFDAALGRVADEGFACSALQDLLIREPLDQWCSADGVKAAPADVAALLRQEQRYTPDLNDGVRVNVAPLQKAGLLAADVLAKKDLAPAIADRAEWRADERRWCREGKLPRPGWWE